MAEGLARAAGVRGLEVFSAGSEPSELRPEAIAVLQEIGIDITGHHSKGISSVPLDSMDLVISLCTDEVCPLLAPVTQHFHWPFPDPAGDPSAPEATRLRRFRRVRDQIDTKLRTLWPQFGLEARTPLS